MILPGGVKRFVVSVGLAMCLVIVLLSPLLADGPAVPVADINPGVDHAFPYYLVTFNDNIYFRATNSANGSELWRSDGTITGTNLISDINPGTANSHPYHLTVWDGTLYFRATNLAYGTELWRTDGTITGTALISDINPGAASAMADKLTLSSHGIYFRADDGQHGTELWRTDGTITGTTLISDINPGSGSGLFSALYEIPSDTSQFLFTGNDGIHGGELWRTDGTVTGTHLLLDIYPGFASAVPYQYVPMNNAVLFVATDPVHGTELWRSDGTTTGTHIVKDINPGGAGSIPYHLTPMDDIAYFRALDGENGNELWRTDGTEAGTWMVRDIHPGNNDLGPEHLTVINGYLFFTANDVTHGNELWVSNGTEAGTRLVQDIYPGTDSAYPAHFTPTDSHLFFSANNGVTGNELWAVSYLGLSTHTVSTATTRPDQPFTYTIRLQSFASQTLTVRLTDTMPAQVISAGLRFPTEGSITFLDETGTQVLPGGGSILLPEPGNASFDGRLNWVWQGTLAPAMGYTFTLQVLPNPSLTEAVTFTNRVTLDDGLTVSFVLTSPETRLLNEYQVYLPMILKPVVPEPTPTPTAPPTYSCAPTFLTSIPVGIQPRAMALDAGRNRLYVANLNGGGISVIDGHTNTVFTAVVEYPNISTPNAITYDAANDRIWATGQGSDAGGNRYWLVSINATNFDIGQVIDLPGEPADLVSNQVDGRLYVSLPWLEQVMAFNPLTGETISSYAVGKRPTNLAVHPTTGAVYVTLFTDSAVATIHSGSTSKIPTYSEEPFGIAVDSTRNLIYVSTVKTNRIVTLNAATNQFLGWTEFKRGDQSAVPMRHLAFNPAANVPDGGHLWTTTSTFDMGSKTQVLLIPKGYPGFNQPIPADVPDETGGGLVASEVIVNSALNRVYVASPYEGVVRVYGDHDTACWSTLSSQWVLRHHPLIQ